MASQKSPHARFSTLILSRLASQPDSIIAASSTCEKSPHARFSTLVLSRLASQPDSIIAASSTCEVQHPRLGSSGFSARLHQRHAPPTRFKGPQPLPT
ncbi:unnamed protein product [Lactuca virosa]|uniref:Uncharacterized protein n=1 Tax=Lactuca virosa TaxID=75947 RepID=A0AAU9NDH7_9ASTR|nr:unnamed protein product [Lactuca virosa]